MLNLPIFIGLPAVTEIQHRQYATITGVGFDSLAWAREYQGSVLARVDDQ